MVIGVLLELSEPRVLLLDSRSGILTHICVCVTPCYTPIRCNSLCTPGLLLTLSKQGGCADTLRASPRLSLGLPKTWSLAVVKGYDPLPLAIASVLHLNYTTMTGWRN
jgi:hypothetical protein